MGDLLSELGPLPKYDDNARLQGESFKALSRFLSGVDALLFRDERVEDYGVDGTFEVKIAAHLTNFRAQVQMKATGNAMLTGS